jgi:hypothetical protein
MTRDATMEYINKFEGIKPRSLGVFLYYLGLTESQFNQIVVQHLIPPAESTNPDTLPIGEPSCDQGL